MELIDRYLQAVKFALPRAQRDDIIGELRDSILSQVEEKEAALGRPLSEDEQVELLKKLGNPLHLASRYYKQQHMIGAAIFPIYWKVLKAGLALSFLVQAAASIAMAAAGKPFSESLGVLFRYPAVALTVFAWVTLVFAGLEFFGVKFRIADRWDPRKLPSLVKSDPAKSRFELIAQLVIQTIFGIWWLAGLHYQYLIFGPGINFFRFGPVWQAIYPLFVILVLIDLAFTSAKLFRPQWTSGQRVARLLKNALNLIVFYFLIKAPELFVAADPSAPQLQSLAETINFGLHLALTIAVIVSVVNMVIDAVRLLARKASAAKGATVGS